jgi:hypothetical protein
MWDCSEAESRKMLVVPTLEINLALYQTTLLKYS